MRTVIGLSCALLVLSTGCAVGDKAGGSGKRVTLRVGTSDPNGRPAARAMHEFAAHLRTRSGGRLRVEPRFKVASEVAFDQVVAHKVATGELEMAVVPARAWGVRSLQALQAPFLVSTDELMLRIPTSPLAPRLLAGLPEAGVVGLALLPEERRHPFGFGRPLASLQDFRGRRLRVPRADGVYATMRALGAVPIDPGSLAFIDGVRDGSITGADSGFGNEASTLPQRGIATGNVTLYAKFQVLAINRATWEGLSDADRADLREAARRAQASAIDEVTGDVIQAQRFCARGGTVVDADPGALPDFEDAVRPVYARLERDPETRALIAGIRALGRDIDANAGATCGPAPEAAPQLTDQHLIDGVWRSDPTYAAGIAAGVPPDVAAAEFGLQTITFDAGRFDWRWRSRNGPKRCAGRYEIAGTRVRFTEEGGCNGLWEAHYELTGDAIKWTHAVDLGADPVDQLVREHLHGKAWRRISGSRVFPEGAYRANVPIDFLVRHGIDPADAASNGGLQTLTLRDGRLRTHTESAARPPDCLGTYKVTGRRVVLSTADTPECGTAAGHELFSAEWTLKGRTLRFIEVDSEENRLARLLWESMPWRKIG
jgi:TRAP-type C4-dicarboxylate transport system substrate-binding protein